MINSDSSLLAFTIAAFCNTHSISRAMFYNLAKEGKAPRTFYIGTKPLISTESAAEWRKRMEAESTAST